MSLAPLSILMIAIGGALLALGGWALFAHRSGRQERERGRLTGQNPRIPRHGFLSALSEPTRMAVAVCALLLGYHLIVWAFPLSLTPVQLKRELWWVWILIVLGALTLSVVIDRRQNPPTSGRDSVH